MTWYILRKSNDSWCFLSFALSDHCFHLPTHFFCKALYLCEANLVMPLSPFSHSLALICAQVLSLFQGHWAIKNTTWYIIFLSLLYNRSNYWFAFHLWVNKAWARDWSLFCKNKTLHLILFFTWKWLQRSPAVHGLMDRECTFSVIWKVPLNVQIIILSCCYCKWICLDQEWKNLMSLAVELYCHKC